MTSWVATLFLGIVIFPLQSYHALAVSSQLQGQQSASEQPTPVASVANRHFTIELLKQLVPRQKNVFFSPFSISSAMAMLSLGAKGRTLQEIDKALHFDIINKANSNAVHNEYEQLIQTVTAGSAGVNVSTSSALFGRSDIDITPEFQTQAKKFYRSGFHVLQEDKVEEQINQWAAENTNNMIQELFPPGSIDPNDVMLLVNAVYFKGTWLHPFENDTQKLDFYVSSKEKVTVPMMEQEEFLPFGSSTSLKSSILELPYKGEQLSMYVLLPDKRDGLIEVVESLTEENLRTSLQNMSAEEVEVQLPSLKLKLKLELPELLRTFGIKDLFTKPDLSGLTPSDVFVSDIIHEAVIDVNEFGAEAAAVTAVKITLYSGFIGKIFHANHPFLFFITHKPTEMILFAGAIFRPE